ncbi:amidohydrolase family protein [Nostoc calcicola FACHB-3891]|nr:amidohydrolase family protein [Nostoc calcicola FACHB-3891]
MVGIVRVIAIGIFLVTGILFPWSGFAQAEEVAPECESIESQISIDNVRIFDGESKDLTEKKNLLIVNNKIKTISATPIDFIGRPKRCRYPVNTEGLSKEEIAQKEKEPETEDEIKAREKTINATDNQVLIPGLIDAHYHIMLSIVPQQTALTADIGYVNHVAAKEAKDILMRGFTSVRDVGGPSFGLKRAIDEGVIVGPRIFSSGAFISQTGGHGDFRLPSLLPKALGDLTYEERVGLTAIADSPDEIRLRAREQLRQGASQLKVMAGGGAGSDYDPLDATQYTKEEIAAAVQAAKNWGTYVTVHAYTTDAVRQAVEAGVKCIEHGQLIDEDTVKILKDRDIWWSLQPFLMDEDANPKTGPNLEKQKLVAEGTKNAYKWAKQYGVKTAFGTDNMFSAKNAKGQNRKLAKLVKIFPETYTESDILKMATADNGTLLQLSGLRSPYPGELGVVKKDALADLLLVNGNPLNDINLITDPEKNFLVIIKDGKIYKNIINN